MFSYAMDYLELTLNHDLNLKFFWDRIKTTYKRINYESTLKLLLRARGIFNLKDEIIEIISGYLDCKQLEKQLNQLRSEHASDWLIQIQLNKLFSRSR